MTTLCCPGTPGPFETKSGDNTLVTFSCSNLLNPSLFGLDNYNISFNNGGPGKEITTIITFNNSATPFSWSAYWGIVPPGFAQFRVTSTTQNFIQPLFGNTYEIIVVNSVNANSFSYRITYNIAQDYTGTINAFVCATRTLGIQTPSSPGGANTIPNIFGQTFLTQDEQNICQASFLVLTEGKERLYKQYCIPVQDVMRPVEASPDCGKCPVEKKALTLSEKVDSLEAAGYNISLDKLVSYSMLRYILSFLLFGKFDVNYLLKKYYCEFLEKLECSEWNSFLTYFVDPVHGFTYYYKFFLKGC